MEHLQSLIDGVALGMGFVGLFGFAIDPTMWVVSVSLLVASVVIPIVSRPIMQEYYVKRQTRNTRA